MLTIRLARTGKRNKAQFKIMLQERAIAPGGRHIEILGSYNPHSKEAIIKADRVKYWIEKGAFLSDTMHNLLVKNGVISEKKRLVKLPPKKVVASEEAPKEIVTKEIVENNFKETVTQEKETIIIPKLEEAVVEKKTESLKEITSIEKTEELKTE